MQNPRLAGRYAKSLMDIAIENGKLDTMYNDMLGLDAVCNDSKDFVSMMKSPIVTASTKQNVVKAIMEGKVDDITFKFINLIINKGREFFLPEIISTFISQYKKHNNINEVLLTTSEQMDEEMKNTLIQSIQKQFTGTIDLKTKVDSSLIGGFILEANNNLFDASILRDLNDIKKQFLTNVYVPDIR
jgi:F-type H+-transporting ATPase subunit delta